MSLVEEWKNELPCQFQGKTNIGTIIDAVGAQLTELETVFSDIIEKTDVRTATGKNLDMVGDIVGISRNDAYNLLEITQIDALDDESYRNVLFFQILKNNADGAYEDIMKGLHLLWGDEAIITYKELGGNGDCETGYNECMKLRIVTDEEAKRLDRERKRKELGVAG